jgi:hypothetical protein
MILLSGLHCHEAVSDVAADCVECAHHMHHSGHFTVAKVSIHDCLLCQMCQIPYLYATDIVLSFSNQLVYAFYGEQSQTLITRTEGIIQPRAPPVI